MNNRTIFVILVISYSSVYYFLNNRFKRSLSESSRQNIFNDEILMTIIFVSIFLLVTVKKIFNSIYWLSLLPVIIILISMIVNLISVFKKVSGENISRKIFNSYLLIQLFSGLCIILIMLYAILNFK
jgi:hypothetical protein